MASVGRAVNSERRSTVSGRPSGSVVSGEGDPNPPAAFSEGNPELIGLAEKALTGSLPIRVGATWTTDAPFRETQAAIDSARTAGVLAVEMEAAALYAFARARAKPVLCVAHVTNQMATIEGDFEKGFADGAEASLKVISLTAQAWRRRN